MEFIWQYAGDIENLSVNSSDGEQVLKQSDEEFIDDSFSEQQLLTSDYNALINVTRSKEDSQNLPFDQPDVDNFLNCQ